MPVLELSSEHNLDHFPRFDFELDFGLTFKPVFDTLFRHVFEHVFGLLFQRTVRALFQRKTCSKKKVDPSDESYFLGA